MDKYFNVNFICATNNNEWWSNHALMSLQLLLNQHLRTPPTHQHQNPTTPPPPLQQMTNDRGVCEQTTVPGCAQTTLAALAKRQLGGLERHLCHTLELGRSGYWLLIISCVERLLELLNIGSHFSLRKWRRR